VLSPWGHNIVCATGTIFQIHGGNRLDKVRLPTVEVHAAIFSGEFTYEMYVNLVVLIGNLLSFCSCEIVLALAFSARKSDDL
jgi:hypothetical protein